MSKYVFDESHSKFDIEDALTINKGKWSDNNPDKESRLGLFVTSANSGINVKVAGVNDYVCGVTVSNDVFLGSNAGDSSYCVVQALGVCTIQYSGTLVAGDKCMPGTNGKAVKSSNNLGYRVLEIIDDSHAKIIIAPNNDIVQRIKTDVSNATIKCEGTVLYTNTKGVQGDFNLGDTISNYNYLQIDFKDNDNKYYSQRTPVIEGIARCLLMAQQIYPTIFYIKSTLYQISGAKAYQDSNSYGEAKFDEGGNTITHINCIYVLKVIGFK